MNVLDGYAIRDADKELSLVYPGRRHVPAKTRSFVDFTVDWFRKLTELPDSILDISCNS